jgi:DUF1365 family protein
VRLLAHNRPGLLSLRDDDYGEGGRPIDEEVRASLSARGLDLRGGRILLCTQPRVLGYVFNPVSFFYCYDDRDELRCVLAEINNTWGERHRHYLDDEARVEAPRGACFEQAKGFRVSPFMSLDATYRFHFVQDRPEERDGAPLDVRMNVFDRAGDEVLFASLSGERRPLTDLGLASSMLRYPLMTLQIIAFIHVEALRLAWKGVPNVRPAPPAVRNRSAVARGTGSPREAMQSSGPEDPPGLAGGVPVGPLP